MPQMNQTQTQTQTQAQTTVKEFFIVGFPGLPPQYYKLMGSSFFLIYVTSVVGNSLLVVLFFAERRLQKPMYIVMLSLALSDIGFCTVALPKAIGRYWLDNGAIAVHVCLFQRFLIHYFGTLNSLIMLAMSLDRFLAICFPLRYPTLMTNRTMAALTAFSWVSAAAAPGISVGNTARLPFCGPDRIVHCYCDTLSTTALVCGDAGWVLTVSVGLAMFVLLVPLGLIALSYISIVAAVLKIADAQGRRKTFSTCATQVCIISIYYLPRFGVYLSSLTSYVKFNPDLRISLTLFYSLFPPLLNPLVYCYRTKEIKDILFKWLHQSNVISQTPVVTTVSK